MLPIDHHFQSFYFILFFPRSIDLWRFLDTIRLCIPSLDESKKEEEQRDEKKKSWRSSPQYIKRRRKYNNVYQYISVWKRRKRRKRRRSHTLCIYWHLIQSNPYVWTQRYTHPAINTIFSHFVLVLQWPIHNKYSTPCHIYRFSYIFCISYVQRYYLHLMLLSLLTRAVEKKNEREKKNLKWTVLRTKAKSYDLFWIFSSFFFHFHPFYIQCSHKKAIFHQFNFGLFYSCSLNLMRLFTIIITFHAILSLTLSHLIFSLLRSMSFIHLMYTFTFIGSRSSHSTERK